MEELLTLVDKSDPEKVPTPTQLLIASPDGAVWVLTVDEKGVLSVAPLLTQ